MCVFKASVRTWLGWLVFQSEEEKARGLPIAMAMFDRETCSLPKTQIIFTDLFVAAMIDSLNRTLVDRLLATTNRDCFLLEFIIIIQCICSAHITC